MSQRDNDVIQSQLPRKLHIVAIFALVGMTMTGLMAAIGFVKGNYLLAWLLVMASITYFLGFYLYTKRGKERISSAIVLYSLFILMFYLVYSGGVASTGPLWAYIVAPVSVFIHGLKRGSIDLVVFLVIIAILMNLPPPLASEHTYQSEFKLRFFLSFLTVSFLSALYEYSRQNWHKHTLKLTQRYQHLALFDPLTELSNRRNAQIILEQEQARLTRGGETTSILLCDIDYFKGVNDQFGHNAGDFVLAELAELFKSNVRTQDTVARWGGEEFLFILPQTDIVNANITANKLLKNVREHKFNFNGQMIQLTISLGVEELNSKISIDDSINSADKLLYQAKAQGRDQICSKY